MFPKLNLSKCNQVFKIGKDEKYIALYLIDLLRSMYSNTAFDMYIILLKGIQIQK